ncbi:MAG: DUF3179 domain-containing protein [Actinobacteria bacterium]|nr:MAG: DUF3179 domain-containing protein [Actinomycetota bacterium]
MPIDFIPSPPSNGLHLGPLFIHAYGLAYVAAVLAAVAIASRRWEARGGDRALVREVALWGFPAGIVGGRLYFLATSWDQAPHAWWGPFAVWKGGLGIWGGVAAGTLAGVWILRRRRADIPAFLDAAAPALLVAQAIGRLGNYFNQELFGAPTTLPWGLEISAALWHEIANDVLGGRPVAVTYCPLCNSGEAFDRRLAGRTLRLGTTGLLRRSDLVMWDSASKSWWQQFNGLALVGRYAGKRLRMLPAEMLSWSDFKRRYPRGDVLAQATGYERPYGRTPYPGYDTGSRPFGFNGGRIDRRLPPMERVLAVRAAGGALAAPYSLLRHQPVVETYVGRVPALILYEQGVLSPLDASSIDESRDVGTAVAYDRRLGRRTLSFEDVAGRVLDRQTHSAWDTSGLSVSGPLRGHELRPLLQNSQFWFALAAFDPSIRILRAG